MVLSYVFSPQYLTWVVPLALLLGLDVLPRRPGPWTVLVLLIAAVVGISSLLFPYLYFELLKLKPWAVTLAVVRSTCLIVLALMLNTAFFAKYGFSEVRSGRPAIEPPAVVG